jgi:hypothetical protein
MALEIESDAFLVDKLRVPRFIEKSFICENILTVVRRSNEKPETVGLWFSLSSGEWI